MNSLAGTRQIAAASAAKSTVLLLLNVTCTFSLDATSPPVRVNSSFQLFSCCRCCFLLALVEVSRAALRSEDAPMTPAL